MKAKFDGLCISCGDQIRRGKEISKNNAGKWVHKHCTEDGIDLP